MGPKFTEHFSVAELACHDGNPVPAAYYDNAKAICERAEVLRAALCAKFGKDVSVIVNDGYRTPAHNKAVGGAPKSQHLTASALDIRCHEMTAPELADFYEELVKAGKVPDGGLGRYATFIHIDIARPRRWHG